MKQKIRNLLWKVLGSNDVSNDVVVLKEQVKVLQYFLNSLNDIQAVPPTNDKDLRLLQLCDVQLLIIIDKICKKYNLTYWLDYGTLLGAVRHKGFIPWDDDTDISMLQPDYEKVTDIINSELSGFGIKAEYGVGRIGVGYRHKETGVWADIFPANKFLTTRKRESIYMELYRLIMDFLNVVERKMNRSQDEIAIKLKQMVENKQENVEGAFSYLCCLPRYANSFFVMNLCEEVLPNSEVVFEGYTFSAPKETDLYLHRIYGDYMQFPKTNVLHHGEGRLPLSLWAKTNGVDMNDVYNELIAISNSYGNRRNKKNEESTH